MIAFIFLIVLCCYCFKDYDEIFLDAEKDHFDFSNSDTFKLRVLVNSKYVNESGPLVFFYCGNEDDITSFYQNSGFIFELAETFGALVLFIEMRYFGKSIPDESSFEYFSIEQVFEDYITAVTHFRDDVYHWDPSNTPLIAFGGSFGGMMASWMKIRYPNFVTGALAASAPNLHFQDFVSPSLYAATSTKSFARYGCDQSNIQPALIQLNKLIEQEKNFSLIQRTFRTCQEINNVTEAEMVYELIFLSLQNLPQVNYPTPAEFFQPLPAYPTKVACERFLAEYDTSYLEALYQIINLYYNYSGDAKCMDLSWGKYDIYMSYNWHYGRCSQCVMPMEFNGKTDFFYPPRLWNLDDFTDQCKEIYPSVIPSPYWVTTRYHGKYLHGAENIIFSNGEYDPWNSGGVYEENLKYSPKCTSIVIAGGAHHEDLRSSDPSDPQALTNARELEKQIIGKWIQEKQSEKI